MSTPILPWHREAAKAITEDPLPTMSQFLNVRECVSARQEVMAERIARHDPHAAQHAETLRLLEEVVAVIEERTTGHTVVYSDRLRPFIGEIRAHLAATKGSK